MWKMGSWREVCTCDEEGRPQVRYFGTCCNCSSEVPIELTGSAFDYFCETCGTIGSGTVELSSTLPPPQAPRPPGNAGPG